jgi:MYXO-CTERM domain-containing protein
MQMNRRRRNQFAFWLSVACALPFAYASSYAVNGAPRAEGCSGAAAQDDVGVLSLWGRDEADVGSDAFFMFEAFTNAIEPEDALAAIKVTVTDEDGQAVAGDTRILKRTDVADATTLLLGWSASGPARGDGEVLAFHARAANPLATEMTARLTVEDLAPELVLPNFDIFEFSAEIRDTGTPKVCEGINECGATWYGTELRRQTLLALTATSVDPGVVVAWEFHLEEISGKGDFVEPARPFWVTDFADSRAWISFADTLDEYCVSLVGHDWKTGSTKSRELCASPERELRAQTTDRVGDCYDPPAGFEERWCRSLGLGFDGADEDEWAQADRSEREMCARLLDSGTNGAGGEGTTPTAGGAGPDEPIPGTSGSGGGSSGSGSTDFVPPRGGGGNSAPDAGTPTDPEGGNTHDDTGPSRVLTKAGCGCRTPSDPSGENGQLAFAGLLALAVGLSVRRRRGRDCPDLR